MTLSILLGIVGSWQVLLILLIVVGIAVLLIRAITGNQAVHQLSCPKCSELVSRGKYKTWQIVIAICFFPIGLLALLADRKPTVCAKCGYHWQV